MTRNSFLGKLIKLAVLAAVWLFVGAALLFLTMPLWGMHPKGIVAPLVGETMVAGFLIWLGSYVALAVATLRSGKAN